ncbi:hypothetical protein QQF64_005409 [Cirrhinus molitorella]|uniref:Uncharacterized protein n=1 Tax=Cirrhinus molitorella TaxID=172907 RepID=A0ABR3MC53_9TELE
MGLDKAVFRKGQRGTLSCIGPETRRQETRYSSIQGAKVGLLCALAHLMRSVLEIPSACLCASEQLRMRGELPVPTDL